ncbi:MAG: hypothetical protein WA152_03670 [Microgenomates group bacterium]
MNKRVVIVLICALSLFFLLITKIINLYLTQIHQNKTAELRKSPTKNLVKIQLVESPLYKDWNLYKSRFMNYSFSVPKDWVIKECQENEDCEYYSSTHIHKIDNNDIFLQITLFSEGKSQCVFGLNSKDNQIDSNQLNNLKYGSTDFKVQMPIRHNSTCFELLGNYADDNEKEVLLKILRSFKFQN